jgi:hypothetical protein
MIYEDENQIPWFTKDRSETSTNRYPVKTIGNNIVVENPELGINLYRNVFSKEDSERYIKILESNLNSGGKYKWSDATVTNSEKPIKKARDCVDFKYKKENLGLRNEHNAELLDLHEEIYQKLKFCVDDYAKYWGIHIVYYEAYNCTVSAVIYINDDYEGGEIRFPRFNNYTHTPKIGDILLCPSNYIYEHASLPMKNGAKYCVVVMTDINELGHK